MSCRTGALCLAIAAMLSGGASLWADPPSESPAESAFTLSQPVYLQTTATTEATQPTTQATSRKPLMGLLGAAGLADPLEKAGINIYGFVEAGYTYNFDNPASGLNFGRVFDFEDQSVLLNQLDLTIARTVNVKKWDLGGLVEMIYGADAGTIHSNGLFDYYNKFRAKGDARNSPENQLDLVQAYVDVGIPVGNGLRLRGGKFVTLLGYETINPTTNPFYSHSYLFGFAIPFTQTGVLGTYQINDNWLVEAGVFRGWDQSLNDNNDTVSYNAKLGYTSTDKKLAVIAQAVTGPEQPDNNDHYRTVGDFIVSYALTDAWSVAANADYGWESDVPTFGDSQWYGIAGYSSYILNKMFTLNGRLEWFRDDDGSRIGVAGDFYEATLGVSIKPFPSDNLGQNLVLRPEVRVDYSSDRVFDDGSNDTQVTAGIDAIFSF